jgi:hypothetical protein
MSQYQTSSGATRLSSSCRRTSQVSAGVASCEPPAELCRVMRVSPPSSIGPVPYPISLVSKPLSPLGTRNPPRNPGGINS